MHLNSNPVELVLEGGGTKLCQRLLHVRGRLGEHRLDRPEQLDLEAGHVAAGHGAEVARQHRGAADLTRGEIARFGDGFDHDPLERTLAQLAGQEPEEKVLLFGGGTGEEITEQALLFARGPLPGRCRDLLERRIDFLYGELWRRSDG